MLVSGKIIQPILVLNSRNGAYPTGGPYTMLKKITKDKHSSLSREYRLRVRLSAVDILIKEACSVKKFNVKWADIN